MLLGPSGCGKTTTMKMINRLIAPSVGPDLHRRPGHRQRRRGHAAPLDRLRDPADRPVSEHDGRGQHLRRARPAGLAARARRGRGRPSCSNSSTSIPATFLKRYPKELSGGQQQRIGVARALAADPPVLLMDEPFGAIDPINREVIQDEFMKLQAELKKTVVFVSHDIDEAVKMATRIAIFRDGRLDPVRHARHHPGASGRRVRRRVRRHGPHAQAPAAAESGGRHDGGPAARRAPRTRSTPPCALMEEHGHGSIVMVGPRGRARGVVRIEAARGPKGTVARAPGAAARRRQRRRATCASPCRTCSRMGSPGSPASTRTGSTRATSPSAASPRRSAPTYKDR